MCCFAELNVQLNSSSRTVIEGAQVEIVIFLNLLADYDATVQISTSGLSASGTVYYITYIHNHVGTESCVWGTSS